MAGSTTREPRYGTYIFIGASMIDIGLAFHARYVVVHFRWKSLTGTRTLVRENMNGVYDDRIYKITDPGKIFLEFSQPIVD